MDLLFSILPKDYYVKIDFLDHMDSVYTLSYLKSVKDLITDFKEVKVEDLLRKMYSNDSDVNIDFKLNYIKSNKLDVFTTDAPFAILHEEEKKPNHLFCENDYDSYVQDIIKLIENLYENLLSKKIDINQDNFMDYLNSFIEPNEKQKYTIYLIYLQETRRLNTEILNYILICFQLRTVNDSDRNKQSLDHIRDRLKVFFKVVGSDFSKFIKKNICKSDPFCLAFIKFNKLYVFDLIERIDTLDVKELCILLYFICIRNDSIGSFIELFTYNHENRFKYYSQRSIKIHKIN